MTKALEMRIVPLTKMRERYFALKAPGMNVSTRTAECDKLLNDVSPLVSDFVSAVRTWRSSSYDLREEPFYPLGTRRVPKQRGTIIVTDHLKKQKAISLTSSSPCSFTYRDREISPLRTPRGRFSDGSLATRSGLGGIDYVGVTLDETPIPVLGEIKVESDADPFYAFVQLLTYLSELCSDAQTARASKFLFGGQVSSATSWDLHILLADFNDRGERGPLIERTNDLVAKFKAGLASRGERNPIGRVRCLRMATATFNGSLDETWVV